MHTMGIDPGFRNLGAVHFDGKEAIMAKVDMCVEPKKGQGFVKINMDQNTYVHCVEQFIIDNYALLEQVDRTGIEAQMDPQMIIFQHVLEACLKMRFPGMDVFFVSPIDMRTFFNTRVLDDNIHEDLAYPCRKLLSIEVLNNIFPPDVVAAVTEAFADKLDDAAEALLMAIYVYYMDRQARPIPWIHTFGPRYVHHRAVVSFTNPGQLRLTAGQREPIIRDHIAKSKLLPKKRKRAAPKNRKCAAPKKTARI